MVLKKASWLQEINLLSRDPHFTMFLSIAQLLEFWISNKQNKGAKSDKKWGMGAEIWPTIRTFIIRGNKVLYINQNSEEWKR